jgi:endonuclease-3 related protein
LHIECRIIADLSAPCYNDDMHRPQSHAQRPTTDDLLQLFERLLVHFGPRHWWPADTPFEMAIGAILTQNTAWTNVEKAIDNLRAANTLHPEPLNRLPRSELEELIYPAGFFRQKSERLQLFSAHLLDRHQGRLEQLLEHPLGEVRHELLSLKGIGPETADSILLYAGRHPSFVIDAYTRRLLDRLELLPGRGRYDELRSLFMERLPAEAPLFNEYHALIVALCKDLCRKRNPRCNACPLLKLCPTGQITIR